MKEKDSDELMYAFCGCLRPIRLAQALDYPTQMLPPRVASLTVLLSSSETPAAGPSQVAAQQPRRIRRFFFAPQALRRCCQTHRRQPRSPLSLFTPSDLALRLRASDHLHATQWRIGRLASAVAVLIVTKTHELQPSAVSTLTLRRSV